MHVVLRSNRCGLGRLSIRLRIYCVDYTIFYLVFPIQNKIALES
ncbi:hypothetical protein HMPREF0972_01545 [Actinomyces sp. oral taxon 848 str. F0332]|nr:hypothetical protein HMPREF0972_01545 [Actinomyces sp. oral taxon 848 str. F0332]